MSNTYFQNILGTTKTGEELQVVVLYFTTERAKYVETKKIHPTQKTSWLPDGQMEVRLLVELNRELEARILEFDRDVRVAEPPALQKRIKESLQEALEEYCY